MALRWMRCGLGLLVLSAGPALAAPIPIGQLPEPIATRQNLFSIPFRIDRPQDPAATPVEVHLYVSEDQGASWRQGGKADPRQNSVTFRAPHDGEYWFTIRTVDRQGRLRPDEGAAPELRVVVDTIPPRLELSASRGSSGEIKANWQIVDPNLKPDSLSLEYQAGPDQPWRLVALDPPEDHQRATRIGSASWWPVNTSDAVAIRAEVSDAAGNLTRSEAQVQRAIPAVTDRTTESQPAPSQAAAQVAAAPPRPAAGTVWPADRSTAAPLGQDANSAPRTSGSSTGAAPDPQPRVSPPAAAPPRSDANKPAAQTMPANPPVRNQYVPSAASELELPPGEQPRMVNSKSFEMEYEVESVGPSGIAKVEMWGTRDGGATWTSFGIDPDNRSPMQINTDGEGIYGFQIAVQSGSGLGGIAPQPGALPEIWVGVDLTDPDARLLAVEQGSGDRVGELIVRWEASDSRLAVRPISILFASDLDGPWYTIASGLENTGSYGWRLDNRVPAQFYLRLEVRDEAGNIAQLDSEPVSIDRIRPEGRIRSVRPIGPTAEGPGRSSPR